MQHRDARDDLPFMVHSELDDLGLSPFEFRVYAHIVRRTGGADGVYWESMTAGARHCRMALSTYRRAVAALVEQGLLTREPRSGSTSVITVTPKREWRVTPTTSDTPTKSDTPTTSDTPTKSDRGTPTKSDRGPLSDLIDKGSPLRESLEGNPNKGAPVEKQVTAPQKKTGFDPLSVELPPNIPPDLWADFVKHRSELRKKLTPTATTALLKKLRSFGPAAPQALQNSVENGWQGVFLPKNTQSHANDAAARRATELLEALGGPSD